MERVEYEKILNHWKIFDEAERWSVKSLYQKTVLHQSNESFTQFIEQKLSKTFPDRRREN